MKVTLLAYTPEPDKLIAAAGKLCYSDSPASEIMENLTPEAVDKFIGILIKLGHSSPIEHSSFSFGVDGVSRALTHQVVRHRMASFSQKSQRYVSENGFSYVIPPEIEKIEDAKELFVDTMEAISESYSSINQMLRENGRKEEEANEDSRFVLPNACTSSMVITMNVRELLHFFNQRCCNRAQWEIRELADEMLRQCKQVAPLLFKNAGAPCVNRSCPEGKMSCGKPRK